MLLTIIKIFGKRIISVKSIHLITQWICEYYIKSPNNTFIQDSTWIWRQSHLLLFLLLIKVKANQTINCIRRQKYKCLLSSQINTVNILSKYLNIRKVQFSAPHCALSLLCKIYGKKKESSLFQEISISLEISKEWLEIFWRDAWKYSKRMTEHFQKSDWKYFRWFFENISL